MGYMCPPYCGEALPEAGKCPCQVVEVVLGHAARVAKRRSDSRRREKMQAFGPVEALTAAQIGDRDSWICGICQDSIRLVDPGPGTPRALTPSIDHIVPVSGGGPHVRANVRITHLWCNVERGNGKPVSPEYMRAQLSRILDGVPVPEEIHRSRHPSWRWPASPRMEYMIALHIAAGRVAADPRYGDPAARLADAARRLLGDGAGADDAIRRDLDRFDQISRRRSRIEARWRASL
jgi:hypothetical protein